MSDASFATDIFDIPEVTALLLKQFAYTSSQAR